jgi:hypothetical protein
MKLIAILALILLPVVSHAFKELRDGSGNLKETWSNHNNRIEIRDSNNNLSRQLRRVGERIEIRDGSGNLIGEIRNNSQDDD